MNPFTITTQYCNGEPHTTVTCSPDFAFRTEARLIRSWRNALRFFFGEKFSIRLWVRCTDPELKAIIDAYVRRKAEEWQAERPAEEPTQ